MNAQDFVAVRVRQHFYQPGALRARYDELERRYPGLKVLFMSGYDEGFLAQRGVWGKSLPVIAKPFSIDEIEEKVRLLLE